MLLHFNTFQNRTKSTYLLTANRRWYWSFDGETENETTVMSTDVTSLYSTFPDVTSGVKRGGYHVTNADAYEIDIG